MTLDEIAYNIRNLYRGGRTSQDDPISLSQLKFNIKYYRAMFIRRDYARNGLVTRHLEQDLRCIKLEQIDASKCCNITIGCPVYRSERQIPRTVRFNFEEAITFVGDVTGHGRIQLIKPYEVNFLTYDKYTSRVKKAFMLEDYLYIINPEGMDTVNLRGIFEDPEEIGRYLDCNGTPCYDGTQVFPMPMDMVQGIVSGIAGGELRLLAGSVSDTELDRGSDGYSGQPQQQSSKE